MRLIHVTDNESKPYTTFPEEIPGKKFIDFNEVRETI